MKVCYQWKNFGIRSQRTIAQAMKIIAKYQDEGMDLTLRQLYYRFVALGWIENKDREYKRLGSIINDARLAGLIDWNAIEDRGRSLLAPSHWENPAEIIEGCADAYAIDLWEGQDYYVEVWVEKQALESVVSTACDPLDVACFACKGYVSQSEMWRAAGRFKHHYKISEREPVIIHMGDHDPSGIDMTRDIRDRMKMFRIDTHVDRIALNMDQVTELNPPPNPAKLSDSRAEKYIREYGPESWELDAIEPANLQDLIQEAIGKYLDTEKFEARLDRQGIERKLLQQVADGWKNIVEDFEE